MKIKYAINDNRVDVKLTGELDTPATVEIQPKIDELMELSSKELVVDCSEMSYIASSGLRQFISIHKRCKAEGGHLKLINVTADVMEVFSVTHFDKILDISMA